jgi:hypothetical protein
VHATIKNNTQAMKRRKFYLGSVVGALFSNTVSFAQVRPFKKDAAAWESMLKLWDTVAEYSEEGIIYHKSNKGELRLLESYKYTWVIGKSVICENTYYPPTPFEGKLITAYEMTRSGLTRKLNSLNDGGQVIEEGQVATFQSIDDLQSSEIAGGRFRQWMLVPQLCFKVKGRLGEQAFVDKSEPQSIANVASVVAMGIWSVSMSMTQPIIYGAETRVDLYKGGGYSRRAKSAKWILQNGESGQWSNKAIHQEQ